MGFQVMLSTMEKPVILTIRKYNMGEVRKFGKMERNTQENGKKVNNMDMEKNKILRKAINIKEIGQEVSKVGKEKNIGRMDHFMKVSGKVTVNSDMEHLSELIKGFTLVNGKITSFMVMENSNGPTVKNIAVNITTT
tara:strand:- start:240 stop:650 length:411 start_codon:yes stop_codon:yes gene_type:complete